MSILAAKNIPRWLEVAGQFLALTTILLPVLGAVMRFVAFTVTPGIAMPFELAPAASLPTLVGVALTGLAPAVAIGSTYLVYALIAIALWRPLRRAWRTPIPKSAEAQPDDASDDLEPYRRAIGSLPTPEPTDLTANGRSEDSTNFEGITFVGLVQKTRQAFEEPSSQPERAHEAEIGRYRRVLGNAILLLFFLAVIGVMVWTLAEFLGSPVDQEPASALLFVAFGAMAAIAVRFGWPARSLILFAILVLLVFAGLSGALYRGEIASRYEMDGDLTGAPSGWYARVAERDGFLYLLPCRRGAEPVVAVRPDAIRAIEAPTAAPARAPAPSIWDFVTGAAATRLGLDPACP